MALLPRSSSFAVYAEGKDWPVFAFGVCDIAVVSSVLGAPVQVESSCGRLALVKPQRLNFELAAGEGPVVVPARNMALRADSGRELYIFHSEPSSPPEPKGGRLHHFPAGRTYDQELITLQTGDVLWIEPGAVVRSVVRASNAEGITLGGGGILSMDIGPEGSNPRGVIFGACREIDMQDLTLVNPRSWMVTFGACDGVRVRNLHELGECVGSDGIDVAGSQNVHISGCFFRNNDDCIAVKSIDFSGRTCMEAINALDVHSVLVEGCTFANDRAGNCLEIGHELRTKEVHDITFRDIDILSVHGHGAALSIHCGDRAAVHDILFEDIRVEHHYDKFVDFRVMKGIFNKDTERGSIEDVTVRNVTATDTGVNRGYTTSQIGGWDAGHMAKRIRFENLNYLGEKAASPTDIDLLTRWAEDITFE